MPYLSPSALFWAAWAALAGLLLRCLAQDALLLRRPACDTTYIYEGYEEVKTAGGGRYRLVKFADGDKSTSAGRPWGRRQWTIGSVEYECLEGDKGRAPLLPPGADSRYLPR